MSKTMSLQSTDFVWKLKGACLLNQAPRK
uniref:Uncharacterized protein n=1 Tax=Arundo donax TaxID=35708 RepID=A0A0A9HQQ2_ARUDO